MHKIAPIIMFLAAVSSLYLLIAACFVVFRFL